MTYASQAYADARTAEAHRAGAERRRASRAATQGRLALVIAFMRDREPRQPARGLAAAPGATQR